MGDGDSSAPRHAAAASRKPALVQVKIDSDVNANQMPEFQKFVLWYAGNY